MKYKEYLHSLPAGFCPFCGNEERILKEVGRAFLTYAKAPYHKHHLLVIPRKHLLSILDIDEETSADIWHCVRTGMQVLNHLGYTNISLLVRDGEVGGSKSVAHLHFHLIPNHRVGDLDINGDERKILAPLEIDSLCEELVEYLKK